MIVKLGSLPTIDTQLVEGLFAADLEYLRRLYEEINAADEPRRRVAVPARRERPRARREAARPGGSLMAYPVAELYGEMAFIAAHFHWSSETLLTMEHGERRRWCREISRINRMLNGAAGDDPFAGL